MKLDLQIKMIDDKDSSVIQQERIVRNINTTTAKETDSNIFNPIYGICNPFPESIPNGIPSTICDNPLVVQPQSSHTFGNSTPSQFEMRLNQLETIVASLTGENAELKERIEKLEQEKMKYTQPDTKSDKEDSCVHNDYVAYLYNNIYPKIDPFGSTTNVDYEKWRAGMRDKVLNFNDSLYSMALISDDGKVIRFKCDRCGKEFTVDRRLITFSK